MQHDAVGLEEALTQAVTTPIGRFIREFNTLPLMKIPNSSTLDDP
jgi:hypothetical protein